MTDDIEPQIDEETISSMDEPEEITPVQTYAGNVTALPSANRGDKLRILEALLFAASEPLDKATLSKHMSKDDDIDTLLEELKTFYANRGVNLVQVAGKWAFRTAQDLSHLLEHYTVQQKRLSKAALETLAIIAYHQPVTRAEIEEIRGVSTSKGTLDVLLETSWIKLRGRRKSPGRPVTYGTSQEFLEHFGFDNIRDLPGLKELKGAGLLDTNMPPGFSIPRPDDSSLLTDDEEPLEDEENQPLLIDEPVQDQDDFEVKEKDVLEKDVLGQNAQEQGIQETADNEHNKGADIAEMDAATAQQTDQPE